MNTQFVAIYFFYGLAFFSMGLLVAMEGGRSTDARLRMALRPLAGFGLVHAAHEWLEMFRVMGHLNDIFNGIYPLLALSILAFSFLSLAAFGAYLVLGSESTWRVSLIIPLGLEAIWVYGLLIFKSKYPIESIYTVADVWTRYSIAIPAGLLAAAGLIVQQRAFRRAGLVSFGRDSLWASVAFIWYSLIGQLFTAPSPLPPSTFLNADLFQNLFGFSIQLLRAVTAMFASLFVIRFLRAFQVESDSKIAELQAAQLHESQQREHLHAELFRRIVGAQESERQRIARDLHDETGQSLTAIGMGLRGIANESDSKKRLNTLTQLQSLTSDSIRELQRIISDLRPAHLDDLGLSSTLRWYSSRVHELTSIHVRIDIEGDEPSLDDAIKITIFRIVQEALNNVIKHSQATTVNVKIHYLQKDVRIHIFDNGIGFEMKEIQNRIGRVSLGLAGMEERAALLGGGVTVSSRPGYGTEVEAVVPFQMMKQENK
ncbi:MAG: sensor histidine kinase [Anaerolineales bacterium]|jgi:signal transduction histidine kinase|nr:sensor histidine kinase [Anaerolineales bacterium]MBK9780044.1 sensor histidine kinase [Anaerolineales bacterium]